MKVLRIEKLQIGLRISDFSAQFIFIHIRTGGIIERHRNFRIAVVIATSLNTRSEHWRKKTAVVGWFFKRCVRFPEITRQYFLFIVVFFNIISKKQSQSNFYKLMVFKFKRRCKRKIGTNATAAIFLSDLRHSEAMIVIKNDAIFLELFLIFLGLIR